jgi:hypothetical protein
MVFQASSYMLKNALHPFLLPCFSHEAGFIPYLRDNYCSCFS